MKKFFLSIALLLFAMPAALAVNPDEVLSDPVLESRARAISADLRCLVCQNQSIDDSNSGLAHDLRLIVRERIVAGDTDEQVRGYVVSRFGTYVLLKPPMQWSTSLLWFGPLFVFLSAFSVFIFYARHHRNGTDLPASPLTSEETETLKQLMTKP
jgi:cytochrome c-type biogenesis protein CcmH